MLRFLSPEDKVEFFRALNEPWEDSFDFLHYWDSLGENDFSKYIKIIPEVELGKHIPSDHVPSSFLIAFNMSGKIVGRVSIRHFLNKALLEVGGHIGYGVCPSFRKKGYATNILKEALLYLKKIDPKIEKALVTCDDGNIGSQKTIEKNRGELENILQVNNVKKRRYWIKYS